MSAAPWTGAAPGRDAFHRVPNKPENGHAVERVPTMHFANGWHGYSLVRSSTRARPRFQGVDATGLALQGGQQLPVVGVQLLQDRQVVGVDVVPGAPHLGVEVRPAHQLRLGRVWG